VLFDLGFLINLGGVDEAKAYWLADNIPQVLFLTAWVRFIIFPGPLSMRWIVFHRLFMVWGILWCFRGITILVTVLPNPDPRCKPVVSFPDNIFLEALANMPPVFWYHEQTCHDVLYSGHTVALTVIWLLAIRYVRWAPWCRSDTSSSIASSAFALQAIWTCALFAGYFCIIVSKFHYTVDVVIAIALTVLIWQVYHMYVCFAFWPDKQLQSWNFPDVLFGGFLRWLEADAIDVKILKTRMRATQ
jgi:hypothetical protein